MGAEEVHKRGGQKQHHVILRKGFSQPQKTYVRLNFDLQHYLLVTRGFLISKSNMSEALVLDSRQTRFKTLRPLHNKPPDSSIGHLFPNTSIRNRPLRGKSALSNYNTFTVSDSSSASQASREVLHSLLKTLRDSKIPGPRLIRL